MDKAELILTLCEIENMAIRWANKSFVCGTHNSEENQNAMHIADIEFSNKILNLRKEIISEGVTE